MTDPRMLIAMQLIMNGQRPPGQGFDGIPELVAYSAKMNERKEEKAKEALQRNQTYQTLRIKAPDLAEAMLGGLPAPDAYNAWAKRLADQNDPAYQLDMRYKQAQLDALNKKPQKNWQKLSDTTLFDPESGETRAIGASNPNGAFRFAGNSVEAQALNGLMESGKITEEQAQQLGAGKTITGENGEIIFMTPEGVFSQQGSQTPQPIGGAPSGGGIDLFGDGGASPAVAPMPMPGPAPEAGQQQRPGLIKLTEPKVTIDERKAAGFSDRMREAEDVLSQVGNAGTGIWDNLVRGNDWIPDAAENWLVSGDFQKYEQARRNFINAQMRRESGAVISPEEFVNADKQYFPQPGDSKEVIDQKRRNRQTALASMGRDAGPTYKAPRSGEGKPSSSSQPRANDYKTRYGLE